MGNPFCHVELSTDNPGKAREFYAKLFNWKFEDTPSPVGAYTHIKVGDGTGGGIMKKMMAEAPNAWLAYVFVESVDTVVRNAREIGGKVIVEKIVVPDMGAFAILADPTGAVLGVWEGVKK